MAKQLNVNLAVKADTKQAQEALNTLGKSLHDIQNIKNMPMVADESYKSAANAAKELERNLQSAVNVDTGKLDLNKFSMSLKKSNTSITELAVKLNGAGATGQQAFLNLAKSIALADNSALNLGTKLGGLMTTLKNTARWQISSSILHGFMGAIQGAYGYAQDLNESLNNIRIVTGQSIDQMAKFADEANKAARALSTTTTEYTNASLIYYQQGLSDQEVKERTDVTIKLANVSRQSAEEVSSQMTAVWNNFADGSKSLEYYADVITKLGASTASSSDEIAQGLQKFAAVADTVGLSYEKATAALATVVAETRQSADVVGTAFKTMFARFQGLSLGETLEDGVDLNKYSKALKTVGVDILDANGKLKDMDSILDDTYEKWNQISEAQRVALAETVAGTRQYAQFMAIMNNYDKIQANQLLAEGSEGTIQKQADIYAESWEAARDRVRAALEEVYGQLLDDKFFIGLLNFAEKAVSAISNITEGLGGIKGLVMLIGTIFMNTYAKEMPRVLSSISQNLMIITGQGEKVKSTMLAEVAAGLELNKNTNINMSQANHSNEMQAKYESTQKAVEMTQKLNAAMRTLSETEIAEYQAKISQTVQEGEYLAELGKELDALEKLNTEQSAATAHGAMASYGEARITKGFSDDEVSGATYEEAINEQLAEQQRLRTEIRQIQDDIADGILDESKGLNLIKTRNDEIAASKERVAALEASEKSVLDFLNGSYKTAVSNVRILEDETDKITKRADNWEAAQEKIKTLLAGSTQEQKAGVKLTEDLAKQMQNYASYLQQTLEATNGGILPDGATEELEKFKAAITQAQETGNWDEVFAKLHSGGDVFSLLSTQVETAKGALSDARYEGEQLGITFENNPAVEKMTQDMGQAAVTAHQFKDGLNGLGAEMDKGLNHATSMSEGLVKIGSAAMQVSMAINGIKRISEIWNNEDLSTGEKVLQTMTSLSMILPIITLLTNKEKIAQMGIAAARLLGIKMIGAETTAHLASIPAKEAAGAAGWAALGPLLAFVGIAAAVVGGIILITNALKDFLATKPEGQLEKSKKATQELTTAADDAKSSYENLKSAFDNYDSVVKTLNNCKKGTEEWNEALEDVNDTVLEIIRNNPQLAGKIETSRDEDGRLVINNQDEILKEAKKQAQVTNNAQLVEQMRKQQLELEVAKQGFISDWSISAPIKQEILSNLSDYYKISPDEFEEKIGGTHGLSNEAFMNFYNSVQDLANAADETAKSLQNTSELMVENILGDDYTLNEKEEALNYLDDWETQERNRLLEKNKKININSGKNNVDVQNLWREYSKASGTSYELAKNAVTGTDNNRSFQYIGDDGKPISISLETMISTIIANGMEDALKDFIEKNVDDEGLTKDLYNIIPIEQIRSDVANYNKELKKLKFGDIIQPEIFENISEQAKSFFQIMEDGTYKLVGNAEQLQDILFKENTVDFDNNLQNYIGLYDGQEVNEAGTAGARSLGLITEHQSIIGEGEEARVVNDYETMQANAIGYATATETLEQLNYVKERFNEIGIDTETQTLAENAALQDLATKYESCTDDLEAYQHALATNNKELAAAAKETLKYSIAVAELAEKHGFDAKETEAYAKRLKNNLANAFEKAGYSQKDLQKSALNAAIANQRLDRGLTSLNKNLDSYKKSLSSADQNSIEWSNTMDALKTDLADIVNMDMSVFTDDFAMSLLIDTERSNILTQALDGNIDAIKTLRELAAEDMMVSISANLPTEEAESFLSLWDQLKLSMSENLETGEIDQSHLVSAFNELKAKGNMTRDQIEAALSGLHVAANIKTTYHEQDMEVPTTITETHSEPGQEIPYEYVDESGNKQTGTYKTWKRVTATYTGPSVHVKGYVPTYEIEGTEGPGSSTSTTEPGKPPSVMDVLLGTTGSGPAGGHSSSSSSFTEDPISYITDRAFTPAVDIGNTNILTPSYGATTTGLKDKDKGSGSGKDNRQSAKEYKDVKNEIDRYHVLNEQLDDLSSAYNKASKAKDRLFGKDRLQAIQKEQTALDKLIKHNQAYLSAANAYREQDKNALLNGGLTRQWVDSDGNIKTYTSSGASIDLQFDEEGALLNYEEFLASIIDAYNQAVDEYNNIVRQENVSETEVKAAEDTFKQAELQYELIKEAFEKYEESNQIFQDKLEEIRDQFREQQDKRFEEWSYKLELKLKIIDEDKRYLEYFRKQLDRFSKSIYAPVTELLSIWNSTNTDSDWKILKAGTENLKNAATDLMNATHGDPIIDEKTGELLSDFDYSQADWMSALDDVQDKIYEQIDALYELDETMSNYYSETLSEAETKLDQYMTKMEDCTAVIKHFQTILSLLGKEQNYEWTGEVLEAQRETIQNELQSSTKEYELAKQQYDIMLARYEADKNNVDESTRELMERELQAQYESMSKWHEKMLSKTEEYAEAVNAIYENTIKKIGKAFEEAATSGQGWESLLNSLDRVSAYQDLILTRTNQVYETNKLMRKLSQDIDKTNNVAAKTKLANFKQEIQDMQNLNRMSKFDLDVANARYEVLKAQIALEEAQNAKSTVRLQRDSEGNYGYVYTADQNQVDDAEQTLADKRNDLYNLTLNKANENARALAQLDQEMYAELERIALEFKDDEVKMQEERNRVIEEYAQKRSVLVHDYAEADYWQQRVSVTQTNEAYGDAYKQNLLDTEDWQIQVSEMVDNIDNAYSTWTDDMDTYVRPVVGTSLDELKQKTDDLKDASEKYQTWFDNFADTNNERLEQISAITNAYFNQRKEVELLIEQLRIMADEINNIRAAESGMSRILTGSVGYDPNVDYSALMHEYLENGGKRTDSEYLQLQAAREAKIDGEGYSADYYGARGQEFENLLDYYMANNLTGTFAKASQAYAAENGDSWQDVLSGNTEAQKEQAQIISESTGILKEKADEIMERASLTVEENNTLEEKLISDISEQKEDLIKSHQEIKDTLISDVNKELTEANDAFGTHLENSSAKINELRDSLNNAARDINEAASSIRSSVLEASGIVSGAMSMISSLAYSIKSESFDTGGYTGSWGSSGKIAMLHEKELVLNATDTANILSTIDIVRQLNSAIDLHAAASNFTAGLNSPNYQAGTQTLEQEVTIHAEFPNATNHSEIEEAFNNLINRASQYANRSAIYENIN